MSKRCVICNGELHNDHHGDAHYTHTICIRELKAQQAAQFTTTHNAALEAAAQIVRRASTDGWLEAHQYSLGETVVASIVSEILGLKKEVK